MISLKQIWAVGLRDFKKNSSFLKVFLTIILSTTILFLIGRGINLLDFIKKENYDTFLISGLIGTIVAITAYSYFKDIIDDKRNYNKILLVAPIYEHSIVFGKIAYYFMTTGPVFFIASIFFMIYLDNFSLLHLVMLLFTILLSVVLMVGLSFFFAALFSNLKKSNAFFELSTMYFLFFSGSFFEIHAFPVYLKILFFFNPVFYISELFRYFITNQTQTNIFISLAILLISSFIFFKLGIKNYINNMRKGKL